MTVLSRHQHCVRYATALLGIGVVKDARSNAGRGVFVLGMQVTSFCGKEAAMLYIS